MQGRGLVAPKLPELLGLAAVKAIVHMAHHQGKEPSAADFAAAMELEAVIRLYVSSIHMPPGVDPDEIIQETVLRLAGRLSAGPIADDKDSRAAYARVIAKNIMHDALRRERRRSERVSHYGAEAARVAGKREPPVNQEQLRDAVQRLRLEERLVLRWRYVDDKTLSQIAARLGEVTGEQYSTDKVYYILRMSLRQLELAIGDITEAPRRSSR